MNKEELIEIVDTYKWIKVKKLDISLSDNEDPKFMELYNHHNKETEYLINKCRELAKELLTGVNAKQHRLIKLLIQEVTAFWEGEGYSPGLTREESKEIDELISFYNEKVNVENVANYDKQWNWAGFDYNKGYKEAEAKYLKIIKQKDEEINKLTKKDDKNKTNRED